MSQTRIRFTHIRSAEFGVRNAESHSEFRTPHSALPIDETSSNHGLTLFELMAASTLAFIVILAIGQVDVSRVRLGTEVRDVTTAQSEASLLIASVTRWLQQADRVNVIRTPGGPGRYDGLSSVQIRIPDLEADCPLLPGSCTGAGVIPQPCCFDLPANYRWIQYRHVDLDGDTIGDVVRFYDKTQAGCAAPTNAEYGPISDFRLVYRDESPAPPGGEPFAGGFTLDNNVLHVIVTSHAPQSGPREYRSEATIAGGTYSDVNSSPPGQRGDSGTGLQDPKFSGGSDISPPPAECL